jgi:hypothetical protein
MSKFCRFWTLPDLHPGVSCRRFMPLLIHDCASHKPPKSFTWERHHSIFISFGFSAADYAPSFDTNSLFLVFYQASYWSTTQIWTSESIYHSLKALMYQRRILHYVTTQHFMICIVENFSSQMWGKCSRLINWVMSAVSLQDLYILKCQYLNSRSMFAILLRNVQWIRRIPNSEHPR